MFDTPGDSPSIRACAPSSPGRRLCRILLTSLCLTLCGSLLAPIHARAGDLYKYQLPDGEVLISSTPRDDLKLIEVIDLGGDDGPGISSSSKRSSSTKKKSEKAQKNIDRATQSKEDHIAKHGEKHSTSDLSRAEKEAAFDDIIEEASASYDVPQSFIKAVIKVESNFNPYAISRAGAQGLMQLMPTVAKNLGVEDPFDPRENIFGGTKLLRTLIDQYEGDINLILAAYNAGGVAVNRYGGIPYSQTRHYVASVYRWYKTYSAQEDE